jgi:RecA-family ATPase
MIPPIDLDDFLTDEEWAARINEANGGDDAPGNPQPDAEPPLRIVCPANLKGYPPLREWNVDDWLPCGVVTGLYGEGGLGKSLLALQLQTSMATAKPWLGLAVMQAPSLGVYCEDDDNELWRRQDAICADYGIERSAARNVH